MSDNDFEILGGVLAGGATFNGLGSLLTNAKVQALLIPIIICIIILLLIIFIFHIIYTSYLIFYTTSYHVM